MKTNFIQRVLSLSSVEMYYENFFQLAEYLKQNPHIESQFQSISVQRRGGWGDDYDESFIEEVLMNGTQFPKLTSIQTDEWKYEGGRYKGQLLLNV